MGGKKATTKVIRQISHLEAALGFITGNKGLACDSEVGRAPKLAEFLKRLVAVCVIYATNATPEGLRTDEDLKVWVQELLEEFGAVLWPDSVPSWAFDPSDHKQSALNKLAKWYPKQLRYSRSTERAM
jgi:hypothetical protein